MRYQCAHKHLYLLWQLRICGIVQFVTHLGIIAYSHILFTKVGDIHIALAPLSSFFHKCIYMLVQLVCVSRVYIILLRNLKFTLEWRISRGF